MDIESLYTELGLEFVPEERPRFLREVSVTARGLPDTLGGKEQTALGTGDADAAARQIEELMNELEQDTAEFSPRLEAIGLSRKDFTAHGIPVSPRVEALLDCSDFYLVHIPVTLFPKAGYAFVQLDCIVEFNSGQPAEQRPVTYQIFPEQEWQDVIRFGEGLAIGLNPDLEFRVDMKRVSAELPSLSGEARAAIGAKAAGDLGLVLGPFDYRIRRAKIQTAGRGNVKARWRLDSAEYFEKEEPQLAVLLQVPRGVSRVDAIGALKAARDFRLLSANLRHVIRFVQERTRNFVESGMPKSDGKAWQNITAGN